MCRCGERILATVEHRWSRWPAHVRERQVSARLVEKMPNAGEVAERFKAHAWKACVG